METFEQAIPGNEPIEMRIKGEPFRFTRRGNPRKFAAFVDAGSSTHINCPECQHQIEVGSPRPEQEAVEAAITMIELMIDDRDRDRWKELLEADDDPLTPFDLRMIVWKVLEKLSARPTERPSRLLIHGVGNWNEIDGRLALTGGGLTPDMDLRRFLNIVFAHLTRSVDPDHLQAFVVDVLREKFDHEMTPQELRRAQVRRKERELGIEAGGRGLMEAFQTPARG